MEPLALLANAIATYIVPKALEKIGEKAGEAAISQGKEQIKAIQKTVQNKFEAEKTEGVITLAKSQPTAANIAVLETVLHSQMQSDAAFSQQLQQLIYHLQEQSPKLQIALEHIRVGGDMQVGNVSQEGRSGGQQQVIGRDLDIGGSLHLGDISQTS